MSYDRPRQLLANFGFTPAPIQQHMNALTSGTAGISAGSFIAIVEPTVDATHHVDGGCRSTSADGSQWACYIGQAAVQRQVIPPPSNRPGSTGLAPTCRRSRPDREVVCGRAAATDFGLLRPDYSS